MRASVTSAGVTLGLGFGGFLDGILLHQILGWHHLVCATATCQPLSIEHLQKQNTQDGFFHLAVWLLSLAGVALLFRAAKYTAENWGGKVLAGSMLIGWGAFNLVEGLVDHHLLGIHHVLPGHRFQLLADILFLTSGVIFALTGCALRKSGKRQAPC